MRKDTIGDRVTHAIKRSRKRLEQVAEDANVTPAWLSALKNDRIANPSVDKVRAIARATEHPIAYFAEVLGWSDEAGADWLALLRADTRLNDEGKAMIERMVKLEIEAQERRAAAEKQTTPIRQERTRRRAV